MKFEHNPQLFLTEDEFDVLDNALKLCRDMDAATTAYYDEKNYVSVQGCDACPLKNNCNHLTRECVYTVAHEALKKIIDVAIVK